MQYYNAILVLLPDFAVNDQHSTLVYGAAEPSARDWLARTAALMARTFQPPRAVVSDHALYDEDTRVAELVGNDLYVMRSCVEHMSVSKWGYRPHISEQPGVGLVPIGTEVRFDRIALWFGDDDRRAWRFGSGQATSAF